MGGPANKLEKDTLVGGKLRVVRTLGVGGMGAVYEVQHEITRHHRALKLLHADVRDAHPDMVRRFLREASVAGTLGNRHIVETFDAGELPSGEPFVLMELLSGESLAERLARGPLEVGQAVSIVRQLCKAMAAAHDKGIVHRDLKPDNTFLCAVGPATPTGEAGAPFVKVLDFGISRFAETEGPSAHTSEGLVLGTPYYMPPEQARGARDLDARADVYALGVILYEALAGRRPFEASSMAHLVVLIHEGKPTPLATLRPEVPDALAEVVAKAMLADRDRRIPDARALAAALAPFVTTSDAGLADTQVAPTERPEDALAIAATAVQSRVSEPIAPPAAAEGSVRSPARSIAVVAALVLVLGSVGLGLRGRLGASPTPTASAAPSGTPSPAPAPTPSPAPLVSPSTTPSVSVTVTPSVAPSKAAPPSIASSPSRPTPSGSSKSQQAGLTPDL